MAKTKTTKKPPAAKSKAVKTPKTTAAPKAKPAADTKATKLSALDAAAQVLAGAKEPMTTKQLVEAMATKGLWTSPGGKTPHATLFSAILREINKMGKGSRFKKTERGKFATNE